MAARKNGDVAFRLQYHTPSLRYQSSRKILKIQFTWSTIYVSIAEFVLADENILDAQKFADELRQLTPPAEKLAEKGVSPEGIERAQKSYLCVEKKGLERQDDPILDLITRYDLSSVEIGSVTFADEPVQLHHVLQGFY